MVICLIWEEDGRRCGRESGPRSTDVRLVNCLDCLRLREEDEAASSPESSVRD